MRFPAIFKKFLLVCVVIHSLQMVVIKKGLINFVPYSTRPDCMPFISKKLILSFYNDIKNFWLFFTFYPTASNA